MFLNSLSEKFIRSIKVQKMSKISRTFLVSKWLFEKGIYRFNYRVLQLEIMQSLPVFAHNHRSLFSIARSFMHS